MKSSELVEEYASGNGMQIMGWANTEAVSADVRQGLRP